MFLKRKSEKKNETRTQMKESKRAAWHPSGSSEAVEMKTTWPTYLAQIASASKRPPQ
jgi:hypothetical protein